MISLRMQANFMTEQAEHPLQRCGMVALIGAPNAGKSTLINALVGSKVAIVTPKVQTTRHQIRGIQNIEATQLIYIDTPGIFAAPKAYEKTMVGHAWHAVADADAVLLVVDAHQYRQGALSEELISILQKLKHQQKTKALVLNKIDKMDKVKLLDVSMAIHAHCSFDQVFMISALKEDGVQDIQHWLAHQMPESIWLFPEDQISDRPIRFLAAEITREKLFLRLNKEVPYGLTVETELWEERADGSVKINQMIIVERESHKKIILGSQGEQLKAIGKTARMALQEMLERPVHLFLFIKVIENWKARAEYLPQ
jgi:GTP-binding protein Era